MRGKGYPGPQGIKGTKEKRVSQEVKEKKDNQGMLDRKEKREFQDHREERESKDHLAKRLRVDGFRIENKVTNKNERITPKN